jgi:hypothetical protein
MRHLIACLIVSADLLVLIALPLKITYWRYFN